VSRVRVPEFVPVSQGRATIDPMNHGRLLQYVRAIPLFVCAGCLCAGCAGRPDPIAYQNQVFYDQDSGTAQSLATALERPFPALDGESNGNRPHQGVEVVFGLARLSRPLDWSIRAGSARSEQRFIEYVSPRQTLFSIYERLESPKEPWSVILNRYLDETKKQGGIVLGKAVPVALGNTQARAFDVQRAIPAGKEPFVSYSREYLARGKHRVVLVQVVRPRDDWGTSQAEMLRVLDSLELL
jgi:hypothetical protein